MSQLSSEHESKYHRIAGYKVERNDRIRSFGDTDDIKKEIRINVKKSKSTGRKGEVLDTISHEVNHAKNPKATEKAIIKKTKHEKLSPKTKRRYYNLVKNG